MACDNCQDYVRLMKQWGKTYPDGWCQNIKAVGCQYPQPTLSWLDRRAMSLFGMCSTQLRVAGMAGVPYGLDYGGVAVLAEAYDFDIRDPDLMDRLRLIESEWVRITHEDAKQDGAKNSRTDLQDEG